jgi:Trk K+ transport system NAD-binding subunit
VARALGVKRPSHSGVLLLGANRIALAIAELLQNGGERVTMIDANPEVSEAAR